MSSYNSNWLIRGGIIIRAWGISISPCIERGKARGRIRCATLPRMVWRVWRLLPRSPGRPPGRSPGRQATGADRMKYTSVALANPAHGSIQSPPHPPARLIHPSSLLLLSSSSLPSHHILTFYSPHLLHTLHTTSFDCILRFYNYSNHAITHLNTPPPTFPPLGPCPPSLTPSA